MKTNIYSKNQLDLIVQQLKAGRVVAIATDTVMGLATVADSLDAYNELRKVKGHRKDKPFPVMVSNLSQLQSIVDLKKRDLKLINKWFPGAITFVLNIKETSKIVGLENTVAIRMPDNKLLLDVVNKLNKPIFLTSANKSDQPPTTKAKDVLKIFDGEISCIVMQDASGHIASTIVDATSDQLKLLRKGNISIKSVVESLEE